MPLYSPRFTLAHAASAGVAGSGAGASSARAAAGGDPASAGGLRRSGDRPGALASVQEALTTYRQLAQTNPAAFLPDLAASLKNLSLYQSDVGDSPGALASVQEAVTTYRQLARTNPAAFLPNLAKALNNLSNRLGESQAPSVQPSIAWEEAILDLPQPPARAFLRAAWAAQRAADDQVMEAQRQLAAAAVEADTPRATGPDDRSVEILRAQARQAIRALTRSLELPAHSGLPEWATTPLPDAHLDLANAVGAAVGWPDVRRVLERNEQTLLDPRLPASLEALAALYPGHRAVALLRSLLDQIAEDGVAPTLAKFQQQHDRTLLVQAWLNATTWQDSLNYHREHEQDLAAPEVRDLLAGLNDDAARQHHAILDLVDALSLDAVYRIITDPGTADEVALEAIETGDLNRLPQLAMASPALQSRPLIMALITIALLLADSQPDDAREVADEIAAEADPTLRRAFAVHLRGLRSRQPDLAGLGDVIKILANGTSDAG